MLVAYAVVIRSSSSGMSSGWQQIHASQRPSGVRRTNGSLTPVFSSPGKTVRGSAAARSAGSSASSTSIHQCLLGEGAAGHTYRRQRPSSVRTREGFSSDCASNRSCSIVHTVVKLSPSCERATTFEPRPCAPARTRYAITYEPSSSSAACDEPAHQPTPLPGAAAATTAGALPGSGKSGKVDHAADPVLGLHQLEAAVDVVERQLVRDEPVDVD